MNEKKKRTIYNNNEKTTTTTWSLFPFAGKTNQQKNKSKNQNKKKIIIHFVNCENACVCVDFEGKLTDRCL